MNLELTELYLNPNLVIASSEVHRWGVFAHKDIAKHDVLQESPYCTFTMKELRKKADIVVRYTYDSSDNPGASDVVLGFGFAALYNHSSDNNAAYELDTVNEVMRHYATEDIPAGSEIFIDYGYEDDDCDFGDY
tara:strand:- start:2193 stop:2594 length:402 start_codon:yes stop_codon:yes gene_type:complete